MIDYWYINNLARFRSVRLFSVSPEFKELCMETHLLRAKTWRLTSVIEFEIEIKSYYPGVPTH